MKYKHLTLDDRIEIQRSLREKKSFSKIGSLLGRDPSTISKEVKLHAITKQTGTKTRNFNTCIHRKDCSHMMDICKNCTSKLCSPYSNIRYCTVCGKCVEYCSDFKSESCNQLRKIPYVCNGCSHLRSCTLEKRMYDAKEAQKAYESLRSESRQGISLNPEELNRIDEIISPLVKQGQSIHHICINHSDDIMLDERTIYNYVEDNLLSIGNLDLPRKVRYRKRKAKKIVHIDKKCHVGRTYEDYLNFIEDNPDIPIVQMDSVEGTKDSTKVLLTLIFTNCNFMLAFLRDANTARSVTDVFNMLDKTLGRDTFKKLFPVILTDRGSEFTDPTSIEVDENGEYRTQIFYCDPQRSDQKGSVEVTHELIRRVLPKKTSFKDLSQEKIDLMMNHINSYKRKKLSDRSPHQLFSFIYGDDVAQKLNAKAIHPDEINLTPDLLK